MQPAKLTEYMKNPSLMGPEAVAELSALVEQFPYFQPAYLLLSVAARRYDAAVYQRTLKKTAIVVPDRAKLFELILEAESLEQKQPAPAPPHAPEKVNESHVAPAEPPKPAVHGVSADAAADLQTEAETISGEVEKEVAKQVVAARIEKELQQTAIVSAEEKEEPRLRPASFGDWLDYLKKNNGQPYSEIEEEVKKGKEKQRIAQSVPSAADRREKNRAILDSIIEKNPGHIRVKEEKFFSPDARAKESLLDNEHLVTETLARIYALQGNTSKAIRAYQILSLKNPQKSAYFAGLIEKLRNNEKPE